METLKLCKKNFNGSKIEYLNPLTKNYCYDDDDFADPFDDNDTDGWEY